MTKKLLLFGFSEPGDILRTASVGASLGIETAAISPEDCALTLEELSRGKSGGSAPVQIPGRMLLFCGVDTELDALLAALRAAGVTGLKAVLTPHNQRWTPARLYRELEQERRKMGGR